MIDYREASGRFVTREASRTTWHSFSFGAHYDPTNVGFSRLVAHNDERLPAGTGYPDHPHQDLEIVTWVLAGALRHSSAVGTGVVGPGGVQRLSAGRGVVHAERADAAEGTRFLQAWVRPDEPGTEPGYVTTTVDRSAGWTCVASGDGAGVVPLGARRTSLHVAHLEEGTRLALPEGAGLHLFVAAGSIRVAERLLGPDDAARLTDEGGREVCAETESELVVWAFG